MSPSGGRDQHCREQAAANCQPVQFCGMGTGRLSGPASGNRSIHIERQAQALGESGITRPVPAAVLLFATVISPRWMAPTFQTSDKSLRRRFWVSPRRIPESMEITTRGRRAGDRLWLAAVSNLVSSSSGMARPTSWRSGSALTRSAIGPHNPNCRSMSRTCQLHSSLFDC
jgi:hypothetical protein